MTDFNNPGVSKSGRAWANAFDSFRRKLCPFGRGRRAAVFLGALLLCVLNAAGFPYHFL